MKNALCTVGVLVALLAIGVAPDCTAGAPAAEASTQLFQASPSEPDAQVMPQLNIKAGTTLGQFVSELAGKWKDVQILQIAGPWQATRLPEIHLRNVTRDQVLSLIRGLTTLDIHPLGGGQSAAGRVLVFQEPGPQLMMSDTQIVSPFGLADTVDRLVIHREIMASHPDSKPREQLQKQALNDVLALIQATLDQNKDPNVRPLVTLHEPTDVALLTGTSAQVNAVTNVLKALDSSLIGPKSMEAQYLAARNEANHLEKLLAQSRQHESELEAKLKSATAAQAKPVNKN